jgi:hypothetical protein
LLVAKISEPATDDTPMCAFDVHYVSPCLSTRQLYIPLLDTGPREHTTNLPFLVTICPTGGGSGLLKIDIYTQAVFVAVLVSFTHINELRET